MLGDRTTGSAVWAQRYKLGEDGCSVRLQRSSGSQPVSGEDSDYEDALNDVIARIDVKTPTKEEMPSRLVRVMIAGDLVALLTFAFLGRLRYGWGAFGFETLVTAAPFVAGWLSAAPMLGGYNAEAQGNAGVSPAMLVAIKCWAVAAPLSLALRALYQEGVPHLSYAIASLTFNGVLLIGWRAAMVAFRTRRMQGSGGKGMGMESIKPVESDDNRPGVPWAMQRLNQIMHMW